MALDSVNNQVLVPAYGNGGYRAFQLNADGLPADRQARFVTSRRSLLGRRSAPLPNARELTFPGAAGVFDNSTQRFFAIDRFANRILVYDSADDRLRDFPEARLAIGQPDFSSTRRGLGPNRMGAIVAADIDERNQRLFVVDAPNNRVLVFDIAPETLRHDPSAIAVIGQADLESRDPGVGPSKFAGPSSVAYDSSNDRLFVSDSGNNRVLIFDASADNPDGFSAAIAVMGQPDFDSRRPRDSLDQLEAETIAYDERHQRLFVAEDLEHRVMVYDAHPDRVGGPARAIAVIGQPDTTSTHPAVARDRVAMPRITVDAETQKLYVSEGFPAGNRVSIFDIAPENLRTGMPASDVIGHETVDGEPDFVSRMAQGRLDGRSLAAAREVVLDPVDHRLFVPDEYNHRVVVWQLDELNRIVDRDARWVLGQPDLESSQMGEPTASNITVPIAAAYDVSTKRLFVGDGYHNRVLVYEAAPETLASGMAASVVIGQSDFESVDRGAGPDRINFGVRMGRGIASDFLPMGLAVDSAGQRLFVSDGENNRVLVFDIGRGNLTNGAAATHVLGQDDFQSTMPQAGAAGLHDPGHLAYDPATGRLFVIDGQRQRIVVFDVEQGSLRNGAASIAVLGRPDFSTEGSSSGGPPRPATPVAVSGRNFVAPNGIAHDATRQRLFVADGGGTFGVQADRVLVFDVHPDRLFNGPEAIATIGAPDAETRAAASWGGTEPVPGQYRIRDTRGIEIDPVHGRLYTTGSFASRVVQFNFPRAAWRYRIGQRKMQSFSTLDAADAGGRSAPFTKAAAWLDAESGADPQATVIFSTSRPMIDEPTERHNRLLVSEAAVSAAGTTRRATIHVEGEPGAGHDVALFNPGSRNSALDFSIRDNAGNVLAEWQGDLAGGQQMHLNPEAVTDGALTRESTLTIESTRPVAITALRTSVSDEGEQIVAPAPLAIEDRTTSSAAPYFVSGGGIRSELVLLNPTGDVARGTVSFHGSDGAAQVIGTQSEVVDYLIPPFGVRIVDSSWGGSTPVIGYVRIAPSVGAHPHTTVGVERRYGNTLTGRALATAASGREVAFAIDLQPTLIRHGDIDTELILVNPGEDDSEVNIDLDGETLRTLTLRADQQVLLSVRELAGAAVRGRLAVAATLPILTAARQHTLNIHSQTVDTWLPPLSEGSIAPYVADGQGMATEFRLANAGGTAMDGTIRFVTATGQPASGMILR